MLVTVQVPAEAALNLPLAIVHFAVPADVTAYVTDPVPEPPVKLSVMSVPAVPVVPELIRPVTGVALTNVKPILEEVDKKFVSPVLETESRHAPIVLAVTTPVVRVQFAEPVVTESVVVPVPEPPEGATIIPVYRSPTVLLTDNST